ncbi:MAG: hypothetical protein KJT03_09670 [Verrucomicrobiae bacterium]|nr:hypothetical protein [Verrucomicrobiae bacterium]
MAKQLIFCSVPHGLQPGRSGYCLAAGHNDLPGSLIRQLEQETSVFPPNEKEDHPAKHEIRKTGGISWHVFSRQTTGIKDYTGRSSGLTHVIVERLDDFPEGLDPKTVLWSFKSWVTVIPEAPRAFGPAEEISLGSMTRKRVITFAGDGAETTSGAAKGREKGFNLDRNAGRSQPRPRPRSGIYWDGRRRRRRLPFIIGLGLVIAVCAAYFFF